MGCFAGKINEGQTAAIAESAPGDEGLQRVGSTAALDGAGPAEIKNFIQAVRLETRGMPADQLDLFGSDDSALTTARQLARVAGKIQTELSREIKATDNAAKAATTARAKGISFERPPEEILKENAQLRGEQERWNNWALHPELVKQVRGYAEMARTKFSIAKPGDEGDIPRRETQYSEVQIDEAARRFISSLTADFGSRIKPEAIVRVTPDLRHPVTQAQIGLSPKLLESFEKAFGVKLVFLFDRNNALPFNGATSSRFPGMMFLDARSSHPALAVAGHELLHQLKNEQPQLYATLSERLTKAVSDLGEFQNHLNQLYQRHGLSGLNATEAREEFIADFVGEQMGNSRFWDKLQKRDPGLFESVATAAKALLDKVVSAVRFAMGRSEGMEAGRWITDLEQAQNAVADALSEYAQSKQGGAIDDATKYSIAPEDVERRQRVAKILADVQTSPEVKAAVAPDAPYEVRALALPAAEANGIISKVGVDAAVEMFKDARSPIPQDTRQALGAQLQDHFRTQEQLPRRNRRRPLPCFIVIAWCRLMIPEFAPTETPMSAIHSATPGPPHDS